MKLLFVADAGSPIAHTWLRLATAAGHEVHVASTHAFDASALPQAASVAVYPIALGGVTRPTDAGSNQRPSRLQRAVRRLRAGGRSNVVARARQWMGAVDVFRQAASLRRQIKSINPELVHALRIPFEGMLAAEAMWGMDVPLVVSVWGNDFTLHARSAILERMTRRTLRRADALIPDCQRDLRLARSYGYSPEKPSLVVPGSGGLRTDMFSAEAPSTSVRATFRIPAGAPMVVNPRGVRMYVRNDTFFQSIPEVLRHSPETVFVCVGMAGDATIKRWIDDLGIAASVRLLGPQPPAVMADLFREALVSASPSEHDGTPNTLLEAMACGALPVCGDIESVREWIRHGENGLLVDPTSPTALATAVTRGLTDQGLRETARALNRELIAARADHRKTFPAVEELYRATVAAHSESRRA